MATDTSSVLGMSRVQRRRLLGAWVLLLALAAGLLIGRATASRVPEANETTLGFLRDMSTHHAQAVDMSRHVYLRTSDPALRYLSYDILTTQQGQIGLMTGWLTRFGVSVSGGGPTMAWMGHSGPMPGMASKADVDRLGVLPVPAMEEQFLRLMIRHHAGALGMADYAAAHADDDKVATLAKNMSSGQSAEIDLMQGYLTKRGLATEPVGSPAEMHHD